MLDANDRDKWFGAGCGVEKSKDPAGRKGWHDRQSGIKRENRGKKENWGRVWGSIYNKAGAISTS